MWFAFVGGVISAHTPGGSERRRGVCFGAVVRQRGQSVQIRDINAHGFNEDTNLWGKYKRVQFISLLTAAASAELNRRV